MDLSRSQRPHPGDRRERTRRKQYRYHSRWRSIRRRKTKFEHILRVRPALCRARKLFQYRRQNISAITITSSDVKDYLREISGREITAKDFRTWAATNLAVIEFLRSGRRKADQTIRGARDQEGRPATRQHRRRFAANATSIPRFSAVISPARCERASRASTSITACPRSGPRNAT